MYNVQILKGEMLRLVKRTKHKYDKLEIIEQVYFLVQLSCGHYFFQWLRVKLHFSLDSIEHGQRSVPVPASEPMYRVIL